MRGIRALVGVERRDYSVDEPLHEGAPVSWAGARSLVDVEPKALWPTRGLGTRRGSVGRSGRSDRNRILPLSHSPP
jgi:hypothetical protein